MRCELEILSAFRFVLVWEGLGWCCCCCLLGLVLLGISTKSLCGSGISAFEVEELLEEFLYTEEALVKEVLDRLGEEGGLCGEVLVSLVSLIRDMFDRFILSLLLSVSLLVSLSL